MQQVTISGHILAFRLAMLAMLLSAIALATAWPVLSAERERAVEIKLFSFPKTLEVAEGELPRELRRGRRRRRRRRQGLAAGGERRGGQQ